jgi:hypothetical protein
MSGPEFDLDAIMGEVGAILAKAPLLPSGRNNDPHHPGAKERSDAENVYELSVQRPYVLVFFESHPGLLSQPEGKRRAANFKEGIFGYFKQQASVLRSCNRDREAESLEHIDAEIISQVVRKQIEEEIKRLGDKMPGTGVYDRIDSRIKFLDRWEKLCDELVDVEKNEGNA